MSPWGDDAELPPRLDRWACAFAAAQVAYLVPASLLAAICDRESLGGEALQPKGPTGTGDHGHGRGLMQIDDRFHHSFLVATDDSQQPLWHDPAFSVLYAARMLARNARECGLDWNAAIAAYNCGLRRVKNLLATLPAGASEEERVAALDGLTTGGNYVSDVRRRCASYGPGQGVA